jgi:dihydropyrimidinase
VPKAIQTGVTSYKMFMTYKKWPNRMCSDDFIYRAMETIGASGGISQLHCENGDVLDYLESRALVEGRVHPRDFPATCPDWAEEEAVNRAITIAAHAQSPLYVVHLSTKLGLERIKQAQAARHGSGRRRALNIFCYRTRRWSAGDRWPKLAPRFARQTDRIEKRSGLDWSRGTSGRSRAITRLGRGRPRSRGWTNIFIDSQGKPIPFGSPAIETMVPLVYSEGVVKRGLPLTWMARVLSENPARIFGLYPRKGAIRPGADADLLIIDPNEDMTIRATDHRGRAGWTLYEGWKVHGRRWMTLLRGRVVLYQGKLEQEPGYGRYLARTHPIPPINGRVR